MLMLQRNCEITAPGEIRGFCVNIDVNIKKIVTLIVREEQPKYFQLTYLVFK
jgi:hypothetical protein